MVEKRKDDRRQYYLKTIIKKATPDNAFCIMEFRTTNLSMGGIFISTEDLSLFELGEEIDILVDDNGDRFYEGKARIVRSARIFNEDSTPIESGFGLMFLEPGKDFISMIEKTIIRSQSIII
ncbi:MAG: PilZ domain-containing protein [Spirochaetales bacterium]|nr:PilZ domain-containing protein [Spirochaetales bacterium]